MQSHSIGEVETSLDMTPLCCSSRCSMGPAAIKLILFFNDDLDVDAAVVPFLTAWSSVDETLAWDAQAGGQ